ncbi:MAG TPA: permease [Acidimicrobiales bacterium]|nr:permease [Acidimicrobiales bacterium]
MHLIATISATGALTDVGRSLREAFYMFWETLWALVLGFGLSGAVQAFVSRQRMRQQLGDHGPAAVVRASLYGMASSSCSYAASAMARSLFAKGADFLTAMVFMFASTNLVLELGVVLLVLIGWQFLAAEMIGGVIMIALLVAAGTLLLRRRWLEQARAAASLVDAGDHAGHHSDAGDGTGHDHHHHDGQGSAPAQAASRARVRTLAGWADAAGYTVSDLTMLRREMVIGFVVAGFLAELVPAQVWADLFLRGHGFWTSLENVVVGPFVAVISFVCSIGNVPLAAALWKGGISFGGVVAFIFADLITLPLLLIYRKQYGQGVALRMLGLFWLVMSSAGLVTEYLFKAVGWASPRRPTVVAADRVGWNYTTGLDLAALVLFAVIYGLYRSRGRLGAGTGYARDPVCGMQVEVAQAPARAVEGGQRWWFCSEHCRDRFLADPDRFAGPQPASEAEAAVHHDHCGETDHGGEMDHCGEVVAGVGGDESGPHGPPSQDR